MRVSVLALSLFLLPIVSAHAHYHMLLAGRPAVKAGEKVTVTYQFGHPFESQLFNTDKPEKATLYSPEGEATDVLEKFLKGQGPGDTKLTLYTFAFEPAKRGDYTLVVEAPPVWMEDEKHFLRDVTRLVIHVQTQKGWDKRYVDPKDFYLLPMTRPYGLRPGTVFQVRASATNFPESHLIEVERYNAVPPRTLPADELITLSLKTDQNGFAVATLHDPGWWVIAATRKSYPLRTDPPMKEHEGKSYPVVERAILWVFVDDLTPRKSD
jgi:uncharacterized GH25 family protein